MKKKILVIFALLTVALLCLTACNSVSAKDFEKIGEMLHKDYSEIKVLVSTKTANATLEGSFTLKHNADGSTTITYKYDRINTFDSDGNLTGSTGEFIVTESGEAVVRNGEVVLGDTTVDLPDELNISGFNFKQAFFKNAVIQNARFEADVSDPQNFTGNATLVCSKMHIVVISNTVDNVLNRIDLTYVSDKDAEVSIQYVFTK